MPKHVIETGLLMRPIAHFSHAARVDNLVYVGATAGTDAARRLAGASPGLVDFPAQVERMFDNLDTVLRILGASASNVVQVRSYLADMRDLEQYERIYRDRFGSAPPSHAVAGSWDFPLPQAAVELDAVAIVDEKIARHPEGGVRAGPRFYCTALPTEGQASVVPGEIALQTRAALRNLSAMLAASKLTLREVVSIRAVLADLRDLAEFEREYASHFSSPFPCLSIVQAPPQGAAMRMQMECVAYAGGGNAVGGGADAFPASEAMLAGHELFVSAQCATADDRHAGAETQARSAWRRIAAILGRADMTIEQVIRTSNVLTDWRDYRGFNAGYGANVAVPYPPRTTILAGIPQHAARVQIEALANRRADQAIILDVKA